MDTVLTSDTWALSCFSLGFDFCETESPSWTTTRYVVQAGMELSAILLLHLPKSWDYRDESPSLGQYTLLTYYYLKHFCGFDLKKKWRE